MKSHIIALCAFLGACYVAIAASPVPYSGEYIYLTGTNTDWAEAAVSANWVQSEITVTQWVRAFSFGRIATVFSYATKKNANSLTFNAASNADCLFVMGKKANPTTGACRTGITDKKWHVIQHVWSSNGYYRGYVDGELFVADNKHCEGCSISPIGTLVLGQDQDCLGGCFEPKQSFMGSIGMVTVRNKALTDQKALKADAAAMTCDPTDPTIVFCVDWVDHTDASQKDGSLGGKNPITIKGATKFAAMPIETTTSVACATTTVRTDSPNPNDHITCLITPRDTLGRAVNTFADDLSVSAARGSVSPLSPSTGVHPQISFAYTPPSQLVEGRTDTISVDALTNGALDVSNSPITITFVGTPSVKSTVAAPVSEIQLGASIVITINSLSDAGQPLCALASDFQVTATLGAVSALAASDNGRKFTFTYTAPTAKDLGNGDVAVTIGVRLANAGGRPLIAGAPLQLSLHGTPDVPSTLSSAKPWMRLRASAALSFTSLDVDGIAVPARAEDFVTSASLGSVSGPVTHDGGLTWSFIYTAPEYTEELQASVSVTLARTGKDVTGSPAAIDLYGVPGIPSDLECDRTWIKADSFTNCTITALDEKGRAVRAFASDFTYDSARSHGRNLSIIPQDQHGFEFVFGYYAPEGQTDDQIHVVLSASANELNSSPIQIFIYELPTGASTVAVDKLSLTWSEQTSFTIHAKNDQGDIFALHDDFVVKADSGHLKLLGPTPDHHGIKFSYRAPGNHALRKDSISVALKRDPDTQITGSPITVNIAQPKEHTRKSKKSSHKKRHN